MAASPAMISEVREGMGTAWTRNGRFVVKKPNATDYGVELAAPEDASRLQVRPRSCPGCEAEIHPRVSLLQGHSARAVNRELNFSRTFAHH
jgi:hypothetical protein